MFKKLFKKSKPVSNLNESGKKTRRLSSAIKSSIMSSIGSRGIPTMPSAAQRAFELSSDPNAKASDFVEVIESDEALSARVIKIANSVYFERGQKSESIEQSVVVIGNAELRNLLTATTLTELFPSKHPARHQIWVNDIATAIIAKLLSKRLLPNKEGLAFLGGLMHDVGKLLMLQRLEPDYQRVLDQVQASGGDFCPIEEDLFLFNHAEVGNVIADKWNFSKELSEILQQHHQPWSSKELDGSAQLELPGLIKAADTIAHTLGLGHPERWHKFQETKEEQLLEIWPMLKIAPDQQKSFMEQVKKAFELDYELYSGNF